jgi:hypothetical protein
MKILLTLVLFLALHSFLAGSVQSKNLNSSTDTCKLKYSYIIETDLSAGEFSEFFCERLKDKYHWHKIFTAAGEDDTYTSILTYDRGEQNSWLCEVIVKKIEANRMSVEMIMDPYEDGLQFF